MAVSYGKFEMPEKIQVDRETCTPTFTRFIAEPFEKGFGHTIGNALRRIMLSALEAPAIVGATIEGIFHEYTAMEGIVEDMTHIVLSLKGILIRYLPDHDAISLRETKVITKILEITPEMIEKGNGSYRVKLKDIMGESPFEMVNPEHHIFTATKPMTRRVALRISNGRGYVPSERQTFEKEVDEIVLDSIFSPVRLVNYFVENTRVGQDTDFDRLILEVTTDGRLTPQEALTFATQISIRHFHVFDYLQTHDLTFDKGEIESNKEREDILHKLTLKINEIELSVRSTNCLAGADIETIGELVVMPEPEMLKFRNFGKKSLTEIKKKLDEMGLGLGMDLSKYGINRDNIKTIIKKYLEDEAAGKSEL